MPVTADDAYIGRQIQDIRLRRNMTQEDLAAEVDISRSRLARIETGTLGVTDRNLLYRFALALKVPATDLTARAEDRYLSPASVFHAAAPSIEAALLCAGYTADDRPLPDAATLTARADHALALRMAGELGELGQLLPDLITDAYRAADTGPQADRDAATAALSRAAFAAALAAKGFGYSSLGWIATDVARRAATTAGDVPAYAASEYAASQVLLSTPGSVLAAHRRAAAAVDKLADDLSASSDGLQLLGMLHLQAALTAATLGRDPFGHLAEADSYAARTLDGRRALNLEFTPSNVAIWKMSTALEADDGGRAVALIGDVDLSTITTAERRARFHLEAGRAHALTGEDELALTDLLAAEGAAPEYVQTRPVAREVAGEIYRRARDRVTRGPMGQLAARLGAIPTLEPA